MPKLANLPRTKRSLLCFSGKMGWAGFKNGELLTLAERDFDVFVTGDRNLIFQQKVKTSDIAVVILHAASTQLHHTLPLMAKVLDLLPTVKPGEVVNIYA